MADVQESTLQHLLQLVLAGAFGAWAWVVKVAAARHIKGQDRLHDKMDAMERRLTRLESKVEFHHNGNHEDNGD